MNIDIIRSTEREPSIHPEPSYTAKPMYTKITDVRTQQLPIYKMVTDVRT